MQLDTQVRELIAIGASITANCQPCLQYHVGKAKESGADDRVINDAIEIGRMVRRGAASKMDKLIRQFAQEGPVGTDGGP